MNETPIEIVEYDPTWPEKYEREARRIVGALDADLDRIEHIGSTAVPGLASKPVIDICAVVTDRETALAAVEPLEAIGYDFGYDFEDDRVHLGRTDEDDQQYNLHVRWQGNLEGLAENLLLREYLRDHPEARDRYAALKRNAASTHTDDVEAYTKAKSQLIDDLLEQAREAGYDERN